MWSKSHHARLTYTIKKKKQKTIRVSILKHSQSTNTHIIDDYTINL